MQLQGTSLVNIGYFTNIIEQTTNLVAQLNYYKSGAFLNSTGPQAEAFQQQIVAEAQIVLQKQLQALANQIIPEILGEINVVNRQIALLSPAVALVTLPVVDLPSAIAFINGFKSEVLALQVAAPYTNLLTQVAELAVQLTSLTSAINSSSAAISPTGAPVVSIPGTPNVAQGETVHVVFEVNRA